MINVMFFRIAKWQCIAIITVFLGKMSEGTGNIIGNGISNTIQTVINEANKPKE